MSAHDESRFTRAEVEYLSDPRRLGRLATVGADGTPHVVPVGIFHEPTHDTIEVTGRDLEKTKKYRDVQRSGRAAIVVDDVVSEDPWTVRGIEIRGRAEVIRWPMPRIRIHPERIVSWGLEGRRNARSV
jgi:pyridoxamine 5'-phosphate oxidase family protein